MPLKNLPDMKNPKFLAIASAIAGASLFACAHVSMKWVSSDMNAFNIAFWNDIFAMAAMFIFGSKLGGLKRTLQSKHKKAHFMRSVLLSSGFILLIISLSKMPIANVNSITFFAPIIGTFLSAIILKEKASSHHWIAMVAGITGVLIILRPGTAVFDVSSLYPLIAAMFFGSAMVAMRKIPSTETKFSFAFYPIMSTLVISGALSLPDFQVPDTHTLMLLAISGLFTFTAVICVGFAFSLAPVATVAPFDYTQLIWAILFGYLFFGDMFDPVTGIGATFIIGGGMYIIYCEHRKPALSRAE